MQATTRNWNRKYTIKEHGTWSESMKSDKELLENVGKKGNKKLGKKCSRNVTRDY